jgi:hypothetical protein
MVEGEHTTLLFVFYLIHMSFFCLWGQGWGLTRLYRLALNSWTLLLNFTANFDLLTIHLCGFFCLFVFLLVADGVHNIHTYHNLSSKNKLDVVVFTCHPSTQELEA